MVLEKAFLCQAVINTQAVIGLVFFSSSSHQITFLSEV